MDFEEFREKLKEDLGERLFARTGDDFEITSSSVILMLINVFYLTRESTNWDTTAIICSAIGLSYAVSCFVRVLLLTGKIDKKAPSKGIIASLILSGGLFVLMIVAVLYGCGIIG
jgi:hypothetical protein